MSIVYTSDTAPAITTGCVSPAGLAVTPAGVVNVIPGSGFAGDAVDAAGPLVTSVQVDGALVAPGDLASMLSAGDEVVPCQSTTPFDDTTAPFGYPATVEYAIGWLAVDLVTFEQRSSVRHPVSTSRSR